MPISLHEVGVLLTGIKQASKSKIRVGILLGLSFALCGFGSCAVSVQDLCSQKLPEFDDALQSELQALAPARQEAPPPGRVASRSLASVPKPKERTVWAEEKLLEVQRYRDAMEGEGSFAAVRDLLSKIADDLVAFHGYAQKERSEPTDEKMRVTLHRMESKTEKLRRQVCIPPL